MDYTYSQTRIKELVAQLEHRQRMEQTAKDLYYYFNQLCVVGFSEQQAMEIVLTTVRGAD